MRNSHILLVGLKGIANETAKNLVLAGIGSLTVIDDETVKPEDLAAQFFVQESDVGKNVCILETRKGRRRLTFGRGQRQPLRRFKP